MGRLLDRYYFFQILKGTAFILFSFFSLYILIDYTSRTVNFHLKPIQLLSYYGFLFVKRLDLLLPFALLIATIRTLSLSNTHNELVAAMGGGISLRRLLAPLVLIGFLCTLIVYGVSETLIPKAQGTLRHFEKKKEDRSELVKKVRGVKLPDQSMIFYEQFDSVEKTLSEVYWIEGLDRVISAETVYPFEDPPRAVNALIIQRQLDGRMSPTGFHETLHLRSGDIEQAAFNQDFVPHLERSLSDLFQRRPQQKVRMGRDDAEIEAAWHKRMALPWLCLIAILLPIPYAVRFSRQSHFFLLLAIAFFGLFALHVWLSSAFTLAAGGAAGAEWFITLPMSLLLAFGFYRYCRL